MLPDLNSLPLSSRASVSATSASRISGGAGDEATIPDSERSRESMSPSPTSRTSPVSLAATATINAGLQSLPSHSRRSSSSSTALNQNSNNISNNGPRSQGAPTTRNLRERETRIDARRNARMAPLTLHDDRPTSQPEPQMPHGSHGLIAAPFRTVSPHPIGPSSNGTVRDPYHHRQPSLGEIHQELEQEQEAQVNRLLQMIRQQQQQLQQAQQASGLLPSNPGYSAVDDSTPTSERSFSFPTSQLATTVTYPRPRSPTPQGQSRASVDLSRQSSRRSRASSRGTSSPSLLPLSAGVGFHGDGSEHGWVLGGSRDESAFYQAETQMLTRENQMLRLRIRELERQVNELNINTASSVPPSNPTAPSVSRDHAHVASPSTSMTEEEEGKE